ncbi:MAG: DUF192 domain-containing protein [Candidatus Levybacteria bacterium]|nr:DUF192 domain-containing protein [Candidatus Levybacteria bacterium]
MITLLVKEAKNIKEKVRGLIGREKPDSLMIKTHFGIHTFGLKFPIDVLILNDKNEVMSLKKNLLPNRIFLWNPLYEKVIELPICTIEKKKIKTSSKIELKTI